MIIIPILFFVSEQTTAGIASFHYNIIFSTYLVADRELSNSIALLKEGGTPTNLGYIMSLLGVIRAEKGLYIIWWRSLWIVSTGFVAIEMTVFFVGAKIYFSSLNTSIKVRFFFLSPKLVLPPRSRATADILLYRIYKLSDRLLLRGLDNSPR